MANPEVQVISKGWKGIRENWRNDLVAAFSVALVALPLGLGIALASGAPPIAGVISAIVGGLLTTFLRGSHVGINGPSAGLVVVTYTAIQTLSDPGTNNGFQYVLAAFMVAGVLQVLIGAVKMGKFADLFPSSVINGMLAAIGVIIFASQFHIGLGIEFKGDTAFDNLMAIPRSISVMNIPIAIIFFISLVILILHPKFINRLRFLHYVPAPLLVLIATIPLVYVFNLFEPHQIDMLGSNFSVGPHNLIDIPDNFLESFSLRPNFSKIGYGSFWVAVIGTTLISSIETLLSAKAVDKLDPLKRNTDLNKDLVAVGFSTVIAGFLGGLPVINVIVRSSVNVNHGGRTRFSNFYHGAIILVFLLALGNVIQEVPLAALAGILVFTGYKLASPKLFKDTLLKGYEQLFMLLFTLVATLMTDLLIGIFLGVTLTLLIHLVRSHLPVTLFIKYLNQPTVRSYDEDGAINVKVKGIANFINIFSFQKAIANTKPGGQVIFDFSHARLVDHTVLDYLNEWGDKYIQQTNGVFDIVGLDEHVTTSEHPLSLHSLPPKNVYRLSKRQGQLKEVCAAFHWSFNPKINWKTSKFRVVPMFESRPIEYTKNQIKGSFNNEKFLWELHDVTFDEGALLAAEVHHATMIFIHLPFEVPHFVMEKEGWFTKFLQISRNEITFDDVAFSDEFSVTGNDVENIKKMFNAKLVQFLRFSEKYHIEGYKNSLMVFKAIRPLSPSEIRSMIEFSEDLVALFDFPPE
jgi:MFS superfamily sulfate permease-like transporter